jgi:hypothetical protein
MLDLDRDLPTTPEDAAALRRAADLGRMDTAEYLAFLARLPQPSVEEPRARPGPAEGPPFDLLD